MAVKPLLSVPREVKAGVPFEVRILIQHPMETGFRRDAVGGVIARDIIHTFECSVDGEEVFAARLEPAIAAKPYLAFSARLERSGTMLLRWVDDHGVEAQERVDIRVV
ncbi:MAG: thiosulfate oxidation carrier complex protein SoxZ [Alphaproteobacteria bacterium]|nr:thiosulfate oxidation carrier complex protein SoxZ [Alphaproteobacteria bacterium]